MADAQSGRPAKRAKTAHQPRQNTAVYVTGLPEDTTVDEVNELFSRKGGVIAEEIDSGRPRIKLYNDENGNFKGDALVVFFKPQSVEMAIMLLDDTDFRMSDSGQGSGRMTVQAADSSYKKVKYDQDGEGQDNNDAAKGGGESSGGGNKNGKQSQEDKEKARQSARDKQKIIKKTQKMAAKLADWSDDEPAELPTEKTSKTKWDKVVVLKHMFTLEELAEDAAALLEIKEDIREECEKLGPVTNVVLFDEEPDGIVTVKFRQPESAQACVQLMDGRSFDGRVVEASIPTGRVKFRQSRQGLDSDED